MTKRKDSLLIRTFITMMLSASLVSLCNYFFYATMPIYATDIGASAALVGVVTGVYTISSFITRTFIGSFCDKYGRFIIVIVGAVICVLGCSGYLLASNIVILLLARSVHGVGFGFHTTAGSTAAIDSLPASRRMEGIGYFSLNSTLASAVGPGIALYIIGRQDLGFKTLFIIAAAVMIVTFLLDLSVRKNIRKTDKMIIQRNAAKEKPKAFLGFEKKAIPPSLIMLLLCFSQSSVISFLAVYAKERSLGNIGLFFTIASVAIFFSRFFVGKIGDRWGIQYTLIPCIILSSASLLLIALFPINWVIMCVAVIYGLGFGAAGPVVNTMVIEMCDESHRSAANSMYFASLDIGLGVGSSALGALAVLIGLRLTIFCAGLLALSSIFIYTFFIAKKLSARSKH